MTPRPGGDLPEYDAVSAARFSRSLIAAGARVIAFTDGLMLGEELVSVENRRVVAAAIKAGCLRAGSKPNLIKRRSWQKKRQQPDA